MGVTNDGIERMGELVAGLSTNYATHLGFASGSDTFVGTETALTGEFLRKVIAWEKTGIYPKFTVELSSVEAVGSIINTVGLNTNVTIGSGTLVTYDESYIGSKNSSFNVQVEGEIITRRLEV